MIWFHLLFDTFAHHILLQINAGCTTGLRSMVHLNGLNYVFLRKFLRRSFQSHNSPKKIKKKRVSKSIFKLSEQNFNK